MSNNFGTLSSEVQINFAVLQTDKEISATGGRVLRWEIEGGEGAPQSTTSTNKHFNFKLRINYPKYFIPLPLFYLGYRKVGLLIRIG